MLLYTPIYPDEINWRFEYTRYFLDNGIYYYFIKPCSTDGLTIPFYASMQMMVLSLFNKINLVFSFRFFPLIVFLITIYSYCSLFLKKIITTDNNFYFIIIFLSLLFVPISSIWNISSRPEYLILGYFAFLYFINLKICNKDTNFSFIIFILFLYWSILSVAHPKALYLLPINILILNYLIKNNIKYFYILIMLIYSYLISNFDKSMLINCNKLPEFNNWYNSLNINPFDFFKSPVSFLSSFISDIPQVLYGLVKRSLHNISYKEYSDIGYLPSIKSSQPVKFLNYYIGVNYFVVIILFPLLLIKKLIDKNTKIFTLDNIYLLALPFVLVMIIFNRTQNAYDVSFWYLLNTLTFFIFIVNHYSLKKLFLKIYSVISIIFFSISLIVYYSFVYLPFTSESKNIGFVGPSVPLSFFSQENIKEIKYIYKNYCETGSSDLILFDDRTYFSLMDYNNIAPLTYTFYPYSLDESSKVRKDNFEKFIYSNYKKTSIYSSCQFENELPKSTLLRYKNIKFNLCCYELTKY